MTLSSAVPIRSQNATLLRRPPTLPRAQGLGRFVGSLGAYVLGGAVAVEGARRLFPQAAPTTQSPQQAQAKRRDPQLAQRAAVTGLLGITAAAAAYGLRKNWLLSSLAEGMATHSMFDSALSAFRYAVP